MLTLQYLEDRPDLSQLPVNQVVDRLRTALELLPITHLLIGWNVPPRLLDACREEAARSGVQFFRWHPLLTGDGVLGPRPDWRAVGLSGGRIAGYRGLPEFTFVCPNHPEVHAAVLQHLAMLIESAQYDGFFLDRIRFPSPARDPIGELGCFCVHCHAAADREGFDLGEARARLSGLAREQLGIRTFVRALLGGSADGRDGSTQQALATLWRFRQSSVTALVAAAARKIRQAGGGVGLDCFAPSLARMVGQDLASLARHADWIKVMTYGHTLGPAGMPFELLGLADLLVLRGGLGESEALASIAGQVELELPVTRAALREVGLSAAAISREVARAVREVEAPVLAGIEVVSLEGIAQPDQEQIQTDLAAVRAAGAAGLAVSWDLLEIPESNLRAVRHGWMGE